jgi:alpha-mannosidase
MIVHMIGYAHLRPFGPWDLESGRDEAVATLSSAMDRMDEYPGFRFNFGDLWALQWVETVDPKLFKRISKAIKRRRWGVLTGMAVQEHPDLMSEAAWNKMAGLGRRYCSRTWDCKPTVYANFELRAFPESLLDRLVSSGYQAMIYAGDAPSDTMPGSVFRWVHSSGAEVLCYRIQPHYRTRSHELYGQIMESVEAGNLSLGHAPCFYGIGNHGGGPSKESIEYILRHLQAFEGVELKMSTVDEFFGHAFLMSDSFPVHRGPIGRPEIGAWVASPALIANRDRAEHALLALERLAGRYASRDQKRLMDGRLQSLWEELMPTYSAGIVLSEIGHRLHSGLMQRMSMTEVCAKDWIQRITREWARQHLNDQPFQQWILINATDKALDAWLEWEPSLDGDVWGNRCLCAEDQSLIPVQCLNLEGAKEERPRIFVRMALPAAGERVCVIRQFTGLDAPAGSDLTGKGLHVTKNSIESDLLQVRFGAKAITRIVRTKENQPIANLLGRNGVNLALYSDAQGGLVPGLSSYDFPMVAGIEGEGWQLEERGVQRVGFVNRGKIGNTPFLWRVNLAQGSLAVVHELQIHWVENQHLLQLHLHLAPELAALVVAGEKGEALQPANGPSERFFPGWCCCGEGAHGLGVVFPDCRSFSVVRDTLRFTLLRSPGGRSVSHGDGVKAMYHPLPEHGFFTFRFTLLPCEAAKSCESVLAGMQCPPAVFDRYDGMGRPSWHNNPPRHLWEQNEHRAIKDGQMHHLKEG